MTADPRRRSLAAGLALTLRLAGRDLRAGLGGFYVFILCIALGVMAIAGVGSVAASLTDGIAREGRVILGGDLSFSLIPNEATASAARIPGIAGAPLGGRDPAGHGARRRRFRTAARWWRSRRSTAPIRSMARSCSIRRGSRSPPCWRNAAAPSGRRPIRRCWPGSISRPAPPSSWVRPPSRSGPRWRRSPTSSRAASGSGRGCSSARRRCGRPGCCSPAAWCAGTTVCSCRRARARPM